jgi:hypothetical protein
VRAAPRLRLPFCAVSTGLADSSSDDSLGDGGGCLAYLGFLMPLTPAEASPREEPALEGRTGETGTAATSSGGWGVEAREEDGTTGAEKRLEVGKASTEGIHQKASVSPGRGTGATSGSLSEMCQLAKRCF